MFFILESKSPVLHLVLMSRACYKCRVNVSEMALLEAKQTNGRKPQQAVPVGKELWG